MQWYENELENLKTKNNITNEDLMIFINKLVEQLNCYYLLYDDLSKTINNIFLSKNTNRTVYLRDLVNVKTEQNNIKKRDITIIKE